MNERFSQVTVITNSVAYLEGSLSFSPSPIQASLNAMKIGQDQTRKILMIGYEDAQILDIAGPLEMFAAANVLARRQGDDGPPPYDITLIAEEKGPFRTTGGLCLVAEGSYAETFKPVDTLIVSGGDGTVNVLKDKTLLSSIKRHAKAARRVVSICSGAFLLAEAGLLDGRRATTHWAAADYFRKLYPHIDLEEDAIYVRDGNVWTSAGVTAGMDLALALIADDLGSDIAMDVARKNVIFMMRPGGQSQFSTHLIAASGGGAVGKAMIFVAEHLAEDCSVPRLCEVAAMSERTFLRRFRDATNMTPAKFVEAIRIEAARQRLEVTRSPVDVIASECGFGSGERMRRTFQRHLGVAPGYYRERFQIAGTQE